MATRTESIRIGTARSLEIGSGALAVAGIIGVLVPIIYLLYGCVFWLQHGTWLELDLCAALATAPGCSISSDWVGLNQLVRWLLGHPFAASCALALVAWMICITISDSLVKLATLIRGRPAGAREAEGSGQDG